MSTPLLVSTDWLAAHLHDPEVRVVDVRWYLLQPDKKGADEYRRGHIPGAVFMDVDTDLASPPGQGPGRHPLPTPDAFAEAAARAGIDEGTHVVAYDDVGGANAARLWWLLRYFGHDRVSLLDGGINRWVAEGRPLSTDAPQVTRGSFSPRPHPGWVVETRTVQQHAQDPRTLILDSRAVERYEGRVEPIDPRAGHVPGARSAPLAGNLRGPEDMRFLEPDELRARFRALGAERAETIIAYCGSGINACQNLLALELAGFPAGKLYEGSWSAWSREPNLPTAVGPDPAESGA